MIAVDTNILVYAHRRESPHHDAARAALAELARSGRAWAIPWPCVHEFVAVVTHPRIYRTPTPGAEAIAAISAVAQASRARMIGESAGHLLTLDRLVRGANTAGPKIHDARIAAICLDHGVEELLTADRDFSSFPQLRTRNPLVS